MAHHGPPASDAPNHPLAIRMGVIAFIAHNVIVGSIFGTTGVLLKPMAEHLGVSIEWASAGAPMVIVGSAALASVAGILAARYTLKALLVAAGVAMAVGWLILGTTSSYALYLLAYGLFLGPAMAIGGSVLPPTLITRWFSRHRGLAIGLAHMSLVVAIMPVASNWLIENYGLATTFFALAVFGAVTLIPAALLIVERPPEEESAVVAASRHATGHGSEISMGAITGSAVFWMLAIAVAAPNTSSVLLGVHLVAMAESWGFTRTQGAALASIMSFAGMAGFILFGWVSDKIGGARTIALIAFDAAVLWSLMLLQLPYAGTVVLIALIGLHGAGTVPALSKAIASAFGEQSFSKAFGMSATVTLPVMVLGVIGTGAIYSAQGSYAGAILAMVAFMCVAVGLAILAGKRSQVLAEPVPA